MKNQEERTMMASNLTGHKFEDTNLKTKHLLRANLHMVYIK